MNFVCAQQAYVTTGNRASHSAPWQTCDSTGFPQRQWSKYTIMTTMSPLISHQLQGPLNLFFVAVVFALFLTLRVGSWAYKLSYAFFFKILRQVFHKLPNCQLWAWICNSSLSASQEPGLQVCTPLPILILRGSTLTSMLTWVKITGDLLQGALLSPDTEQQRFRHSVQPHSSSCWVKRSTGMNAYSVPKSYLLIQMLKLLKYVCEPITELNSLSSYAETRDAHQIKSDLWG